MKNSIKKKCNRGRSKSEIDYTGQKFNFLTVLSEFKKGKEYYFSCRCDCGHKKTTYKYSVLRGEIKTCGAKECRDKIPGYRVLPVIGQKYNHFTVLSHYTKEGVRFFVCRCDCGKVIDVNAYAVRTGHSKSCGRCNDISSKDHTGKKYNFLTVLSQFKKQYKKGSIYYFLCKCDFCGCETEKPMGPVVKGKLKTCGAIECKKRIPGYQSVANHVGKKFSHLTVLSQFKKNSIWYFSCQCDCGRKKTIKKSTILSRAVKSCGCLAEKCLRAKQEKTPLYLSRAENSSVYAVLITMGYRDNGRKIGVMYNQHLGRYRWYAVDSFKKTKTYYSFKTYDEALEKRLELQEKLYMPFIRRNKKLLPKKIDINYWLNLNTDKKFNAKKYERDKKAGKIKKGV